MSALFTVGTIAAGIGGVCSVVLAVARPRQITALLILMVVVAFAGGFTVGVVLALPGGP